jgi:dolichol-phosphate hexosyltransferase
VPPRSRRVTVVSSRRCWPLGVPRSARKQRAKIRGLVLAAEYRPDADSLCGIATEPQVWASLPEQTRPADQRLAHGRTPHRRAYRHNAGVKLSIIMAAYNEAETITDAVQEVLEVDYPCDVELLVVDDGSRDATPQLLAQLHDPRLTVIRHPANLGKGAAVLSAVAVATGTHMLPFDADLEYMPDDILRLVEPVLRGRCNVVYGVRLFGCNTVYRSFLYAVGNKIFTRTANVLFGAWLSDLHTCLKLIPVDLVRSLRLRETGFGLDTELSASLLRCGIRPFEVPVSYFSRSHEEGKKINWRDALACLWILLRVRTMARSQFRQVGELDLTARRRSAARPVSPADWQRSALLENDAVSELTAGTG